MRIAGFGKIKLKHQIFLLIGIAITMVTVIQSLYYVQFYSIMKKRAAEYVANIMYKIEKEITTEAELLRSVADSVSYNKITQQYLQSEDQIERMDLGKNVMELLAFAKTSAGSVEDIILYDRHRNITYTDFDQSSFYVNMITYFESEYSIGDGKRGMAERDPRFSAVIAEPNGQGFYYAYIYPVYNAQADSPNVFQYIGYCIVLSKLKTVEHAIQNVGLTENSVFMIVDAENRIVAYEGANYDNYKTMVNTDGQLGAEQMPTELDMMFDRRGSLIDRRAIPAIGWTIVGAVPLSEITSDLKIVRDAGIIMELAMLAILGMVGLVLIRSISAPIFKIIRFIGSVPRKYTGKRRLVIYEKNEVGQLADYINDMLDQLEKVNEDIIKTQQHLYQTELAKKKSQLAALQSQINPHFLYNTLDCIKSIALERDVRDIALIASSMASIFRYAIKEEDLVHIKHELDLIRKYVTVMNVRYEGKFSLIVNVEERLLEQTVPKMVLQPIVENAIYHGLEMKRGKGSVTITGTLVDRRTICFQIDDDGKGMSSAELTELHRRLDAGQDAMETAAPDAKRSIGLYNIHSRIKLQYGPQYGIRIDSVENRGTRVAVALPAMACSSDILPAPKVDQMT